MEVVQYLFTFKGVKTDEEAEEIFLEINNCEFCNNDTFALYVKDFKYNADEDISIANTDVIYDGVDIEDALCEMINCEFCHNDIALSFKPLKKNKI